MYDGYNKNYFKTHIFCVCFISRPWRLWRNNHIMGREYLKSDAIFIFSVLELLELLAN